MRIPVSPTVGRIDHFHGLNMSAMIFGQPALFWVTYSFDFKPRERGLAGKFECRQNIFSVKKI